jgi:putative transposase
LDKDTGSKLVLFIMRKFQFVNGEYYHIYNRGVDKREVFLDEGDYGRFLRSLQEFNNTSTHDQRVYIKNKMGQIGATELSSEASELSSVRDSRNVFDINDLQTFLDSLPNLVSILAYCFNPNHFHLLLQQSADKGIEQYMHKLGSGYTNFFNIKYKRSGSLFEGPFKAVQIDSEEHLLWVAAYVNGNAQIHGIISDADKYEWCSYSEYLGKSDSNICVKGNILDKFKDVESFQKASEECFKKMKERKDLQKYILD